MSAHDRSEKVQATEIKKKVFATVDFEDDFWVQSSKVRCYSYSGMNGNYAYFPLTSFPPIRTMAIKNLMNADAKVKVKQQVKRSRVGSWRGCGST